MDDGLELNVELLDWQQLVYADASRFKVVAAGRRTGKSRLAAWMLIISALEHEGGNVFYVAPTQGQARDILWNDLLELGHGVISGSHINNLQIKLVNGSIISLKGADRPETMRGVKLRFLVMDEYADMKPEVWEQILRPALADHKGSAMFIGTPMGRNHFYELFKYAELGGDETYSAWHFTSYDNPKIDPEEINAAKRGMSSYAFRQEFMASFEAQGSEMFKDEWVKYGDKPESGDYYVAIDLAGFQDVTKKKTKSTKLDETAISIVKVSDDGDWYVENIVHGRWSLDETAIKIFQIVRDYEPISVGIEKGIAKQAVMSPLMDLQKKYAQFFRVEELSHGNKRKTDRVMWALQGRFENGIISLNKGDWNAQFLDQLFQFPDPLTHDDLVDSLAYIDQLANVPYGIEDIDFDEPEILDIVAGY